MRAFVVLLLLPCLIFAQKKGPEINSLFADYVIESDSNLFIYKQDLGLLHTDISPEEQTFVKELHKVKSEHFQINYKANLNPLYRNPMIYDAFEYQVLGSEGMFYTNILGGLIETFIGELTFKL